MSGPRRGSSTAMYFRMLARAAMLRKGRAAAALTALAVAAAAATAMLNLFVDVQRKLGLEFRNFGANIIVQTKPGQSFSPDTLKQLGSVINGRGLVVPFGYAVARTDRDQAVVVAGTDLALAKKLNPWWEVSAWPQSSGLALAGVRAAKVVSPQGQPFALHYQGRPIQLSVAGTVRTGAGEDSRIYLSLHDFQAWTGLNPTVAEISVYGTPQDVEGMLRTLQQKLPFADVRAVRQVTEGEANVLGKTRSTLLSSTALIVCTAALCVLATLMGWVFDRRRDFAIMKALGASDRLILLFVAGEAGALAVAGAVLGFAAGIGIAAWIGRVNFQAAVSPQFSVFPEVLIGAILVTLLSTLLPLRLLRRIQPAMILRGE